MLETFLEWFAIFMAFNLNALLFFCVYKTMDRNANTGSAGRRTLRDDIYSPPRRSEGYPRRDFGPEPDLPEIDSTSLDASGKPFWERDAGTSASCNIPLVTHNPPPSFKVETSFASGKLGALRKSE